MMKLSVATNFQDDLIPRLNKKEVYELYGKLTADFVGGCAASYSLPFLKRNQVRRHVEQAHHSGLEFNYLLNATCLGNREYTIAGQKKLYRLLDWVCSLGANSVTVSIPYLLQLIKKHYPELKIKVSAGAIVDTIMKAKNWEDLGADLIVLHPSINRNFDLLVKIKKYIKCKVQLIANFSCFYYCVFLPYHISANSHASQTDNGLNGYTIDYCALNCRYQRLLNPIHLIRTRWIRPEDIHYYEEIGIDNLKILDRSACTEDICRVTEAYSSRRYEGNLMDLLISMSKGKLSAIEKIKRGMRYFFRPFQADLLLIYKMSKLLPGLQVYIDNRSLDGFLEYSVKGNCKDGMCQDCGYCQKIAERVVKIDKDYRDKTILKYKDILNSLC